MKSLKSIENTMPVGIPKHVLELREAIYNGISGADMADIVKKQVELAKAGDLAAAKFIVDYVLASQIQPIQVTQNILIQSNEATNEKPGTKEKVEVMAARHANGQELFIDGDAKYGEAS